MKTGELVKESRRWVAWWKRYGKVGCEVGVAVCGEEGQVGEGGRKAYMVGHFGIDGCTHDRERGRERDETRGGAVMDWPRDLDSGDALRDPEGGALMIGLRVGERELLERDGVCRSLVDGDACRRDDGWCVQERGGACVTTRSLRHNLISLSCNVTCAKPFVKETGRTSGKTSRASMIICLTREYSKLRQNIFYR